MADDKLDLPDEYDADADPVDVTERAPRGVGALVDGLRRLGKTSAQIALLDARRKKLQKDLMPFMRTPLLMQHPVTKEPVIVAASQARPIKVDVAELRKALIEHFTDQKVIDGMAEQEEVEAYHAEIAEQVEVIVGDVLKPPEVDTKENGLFVKACEQGRIPLEVVAKVAKEKPSSAYIGFNPLRNQRS